MSLVPDSVDAVRPQSSGNKDSPLVLSYLKSILVRLVLLFVVTLLLKWLCNFFEPYVVEKISPFVWDFLKHVLFFLLFVLSALCFFSVKAGHFLGSGLAGIFSCWGFWLCAVYVVFALIALFAGNSFFVGSALEGLGRAYSGGVPQLVSLALLGVLTPIGEELFFRGALLKWKGFSASMPLKHNMFWSVYFSALVFWVFHIEPSGQTLDSLLQGYVPLPLGTFLLGLCCGFVAWKDGSIHFAVVLHGLANLMGPFWLPLLQKMQIFSWFYR